MPVSIRLKSTEKTPTCVSMRAFLQPISARIYFGKTASHRKRARLVQSRGASPQAYWMSVKAAQRWGCAKRAFCGVCFLMPGGLSARLLFVGRDTVRGRGKSPSPTGRDGFPRQCVPQGHLLRSAHWLGMTARRAGNGGTHGSRPTGCGGHPGRTESSAPTRQNRNRAKRDVEDAVPYILCHCEERSDAAIRSPQPKETDSHASDTVTGAE